MPVAIDAVRTYTYAAMQVAATAQWWTATLAGILAVTTHGRWCG